jgi:hypothetical protein
MEKTTRKNYEEHLREIARRYNEDLYPEDMRDMIRQFLESFAEPKPN